MRAGKVPGPLRRKFDLDAWKKAAAELADDERDQVLSDIGGLLFRKAESIRRLLKFVSATDVNTTTKLRALVAFANHNSAVLSAKAKQMADGAKREHNTVGMAEIITGQIALPNGFSYLPNEISQSIVDGIEIPVRFVMSGGVQADRKPQFNQVRWSDVQLDANLGLAYALVEGLWDDCLWNDLRVRREGEVCLFTFADQEWEKRSVISKCRADNLNLQFFSSAVQWFRSQPPDVWEAVVRVRTVEAVVKEGRQRRLRLTKTGQRSEIGFDLALLRLRGQEPYYREFISQPVELLGGATLDDLMSAWAIVSSASAAVSAAAEATKAADDAPPEKWMPNYAPILTTKALVEAVQTGARFHRSRAETLVEFLTFRGKPSEELWTQPLVPVADGRVAPVFGAAWYPNLSRLVDRWMQQLGFDMSERGPAFERYVRQELGDAIRASSLSRIASIVPNALRLRPEAEREEEIDLVFTVGTIVFIGEAKCVLLPTEAKQDAMHRQTVEGAVDQIKRKAEAVERHRNLFLAELQKLGATLPENFRLIPLVVLNGPVNAGFQIDGVTVVDANILRIFFEGQIVDFAHASQEGRIENVETRTFYASPEQAPETALRYFASPPQLDFVKTGLRERIVPVPAVSDDDWPGIIHTFECSLQTPERAFRDGNGPP